MIAKLIPKSHSFKFQMKKTKTKILNCAENVCEELKPMTQQCHSNLETQLNSSGLGDHLCVPLRLFCCFSHYSHFSACPNLISLIMFSQYPSGQQLLISETPGQQQYPCWTLQSLRHTPTPNKKMQFEAVSSWLHYLSFNGKTALKLII